MCIYYLYIKTHKITGLKYLGQTKQNPYRYIGSGVDWLTHLKEHGKSVHTEILVETIDQGERNAWGRYYSTLWNIVEGQDDFGNKIWANRIIESGGGSGRKPGFITSDATKAVLSVKGTGRYRSPESSSKQAAKLRQLFTTKSQWNKGISYQLTTAEKSAKYGKFKENNHSFGQPVAHKICPHCGTSMDCRNYARYHGDNCKNII
jgi:hypothetical protein